MKSIKKKRKCKRHNTIITEIKKEKNMMKNKKTIDCLLNNVDKKPEIKKTTNKKTTEKKVPDKNKASKKTIAKKTTVKKSIVKKAVKKKGKK
jgi:hypothetical protein